MTWKERLTEGGVLLIDGGIGSELRRRGVRLSGSVWSAHANLDEPGTLTGIHSDYIRAGAEIITANTFATNRFVLRSAGLESRYDEINRNAVRAARSAADASGRDVAVAASISCMPPAFDFAAYPEPETEHAAYRELVGQLADLGVDLILLEMMQETEHAALACEAARESELPIWLGLSCRLREVRAGIETGANAVSGPGSETEASDLVAFDFPDVDFGRTLDALLHYEPDAVCIMHTPIDAVLPALERVRRAWSGPTGVYAETGYPEDPQRPGVERVSPEDYAAEAREWIASGAGIVGGCCGTTPEHIRALRELIRGSVSD
jgi:S-methylmethionine-dependent homocysteine/selenocysteine methylase